MESIVTLIIVFGAVALALLLQISRHAAKTAEELAGIRLILLAGTYSGQTGTPFPALIVDRLTKLAYPDVGS